MAEYRVFVYGKTGQILNRHDFQAANDAAALEHARQYSTSSAVEVWQLERLVGTLQPKQ